MKRSLILLFMTLLACKSSFAQIEGNSIQLKADGNFISIADAGSVSLNDTMTIEMMLYFRCNNAQSTHLITKGWCGSTWSFYFSIFNSKLRLGRWHTGLTGCAGNQALFESTDSIEVNTWTHVAVRVVDLNVDFLINGVNAGSTLLSGTNGDGFHTSNQPLRIGNYVNLGGTNTGTPKANIDEVRIWHTARTDAELLANMTQELVGNEPGLKAYYKLNETGSGAGISVANSALGSPLPNGTTAGTVANILFTNNTTIQNSIPNCDPILWLKADAGITLNGFNEVTQWADQSGNNNHAIADGTTLPTVIPNAINNKPVVDFTDDRLATPLVNLTATNQTEIFVVYKGIGANPFLPLEFSDDGNVVATGFYLADQDNSCPGCINDVAAGLKGNVGYNQNSLNQTQGCPKIINVSYDKSLATEEVKIRLNGILQPKTPGTTNDNNTNNFGSHKFYLGKRSANCVFCPGVMGEFYYAEIIVYNRLLSALEKNTIKNYLHNKYFAGTDASFIALAPNNTTNDAVYDDNVWKHTYISDFPDEVIASVKDNCLELGSRSDTVFVEPTAGFYNGQAYMRRHYVISTGLNPAGNKRVRLYYTNADFADLQTVLPSLTNHNQLVVTKYDGPNVDGVYNPAGGTITVIPSAQITTGTAFGQRYLEFDVTSFSEFWIHTGNAPLPLDLISFTAIKENNHANLNWQTANMKNVLGFEIEKSMDAKSFTKIGFLASTENKDYSFRDTKLFGGNNFYRLKMVDQDGKFSYSKVVTLSKLDKPTCLVFPNPVKKDLTISSSESNFSFQILDMCGRVRINEISVEHSKTISCESLQKGIYFIRMEMNGYTEVSRFVKD